MKKILFLTETFPPDLCGVADYVLMLASNLVEEYEVHIVTRKSDSNSLLLDKRINLYEILSGKAYIFQAIRTINVIQPDIVDVQLAYSGSGYLHKENLLTLMNALAILSLTQSTKRCLTIHELSSFLDDAPSFLRVCYRAIRDYCQTRFYDYYLCMSRKYLTYLKKAENKLALLGFSNVPTIRNHNRIENRNLIFFGTIGHNKKIDSLIQVFRDLNRGNPCFHLTFVGGIVEGFESTFFCLLKSLPRKSWSYEGRLSGNELATVLDRSSYAIFPFLVTDKNTSVLAMLANRLVVIALCESLPTYAQNGNSFYGLSQLSASVIRGIVSDTLGKTVSYPDSNQLLSAHLMQRREIYERLLTSSA